MTTANLIPDLERDEGLRLSAYQDTRGIWTVGYGHAYVHPGTVWTAQQALDQLHEDVDHVTASLDIHLSWWRDLDPVRQDVVAEMAFNMGLTTLMQFHNTLAAVKSQQWAQAAAGMLHSEWATQVGQRADRLAEQMLTGVHQP
jgi:lysozyme